MLIFSISVFFANLCMFLFSSKYGGFLNNIIPEMVLYCLLAFFPLLLLPLLLSLLSLLSALLLSLYCHYYLL